MIASGFSWFRLIPAVDHDKILESLGWVEHSIAAGHESANTTVHLHAWLATFILIGLAVVGRMALERAKSRRGIERYFSDERPSALSMVEVFATGIKGLMNDLLDAKDVRLFFPLIAGLFAYIFMCNIQGIFPGMLPPTDNINTNVGMAVTSFLVFNFVGLSRDAVGYIKHLAGPALFLVPLMFPLEVVSLIIRPISLTVRLTANMFGDHQVFTIISDMVPVFLPVGLLTLACLVSVIQAFVFSLLTVIYINLSLPHHEHEAH
jgi:F-type H+-transporting ATPase subunit a